MRIMALRRRRNSPKRKPPSITVRMAPFWILCLAVAVLLLLLFSVAAVVSARRRRSPSRQQRTVNESEQHPPAYEKPSPLQQRVQKLLHDAILINQYIDTEVSKHSPQHVTTIKPDDDAVSCHDTDDSSSTTNDSEEDALLSARLDEMDRRVKRVVPDIHHRHVPLGGKRPWYSRELLWQHYSASMDMQHEVTGTNEQNWATHVHFPRTLCLRTPCSIETSIHYSLQWRESYQPWRVTPAMIRENTLGYVYAYGRSRDGQGLVHYRPGVVERYQDEVSYFRCVFHAIEAAIAETGTFTAVVDAANFQWHKVPNLRYWVRQTITMLKDHYPHRLGGVFVYNMSSMTEMVMQLLRPLLPARVRGLIHIVKTRKDLVGVLGNALAEDDDFTFHAESYYEPHRFHWSDEEGRQYLNFIKEPA